MGEPTLLHEWRQMRPPQSHWRRRAREVMRSVVDANPAPDLLLGLVDAAYPFGEREMLPYKQWLVERRLLIAALAGPRTMPTADEAGACEVARDLVELGREDEAQALLEKLAPHRLARRCPACDAAPARPCRDFLYEDPPVQGYGQYPTGEVHLIVPHHARLVGHLDAGPLFKER